VTTMAQIIRVNLLVSEFDKRILESLNINVAELCRDTCRESIRSEMLNRTVAREMIKGVHVDRVPL